VKTINGLKDIIDDFDTFILDQWRVLHNGAEAFPEAIQELQFLKEHNIAVIQEIFLTHVYRTQALAVLSISRC
jgi:ribonucleotide monophosphatase NagD (HAD superfamily)